MDRWSHINSSYGHQGKQANFGRFRVQGSFQIYISFYTVVSCTFLNWVYINSHVYIDSHDDHKVLYVFLRKYPT